MNKLQISIADSNINQYSLINRKNCINFCASNKDIQKSRKWIKSIAEISEKDMPKFCHDTERYYKQLGIYNYILLNKQKFNNMLNYEKLSVSDQEEIKNFVISQIEKCGGEEHANNMYGGNRFLRTIKYGTKRIINVVHRSNLKEENLQKTEYYMEQGIFEFLSKNLKNFKIFLAELLQNKADSSLNKTVAESFPLSKVTDSKPHWVEYKELKKKVEQYNREIENTPEGKARDTLIEKRVEAYKKLEEYKIRAKAEDFSLIEMKDLSGASEIERWEYFEKYAFPLMENNEASTLDGIEMFEKYGMRKQLDGEHDLWHTTLERFMLSIPNRPSDRVIGRLFDVAYKYAEPNTKNDYYEVLTLQYLLSDLETHRIVDNIGEDSFLKAVKLAEKLEYWKTQYRDIPSDMEWRYIERKFAKSPRLPELKTAVEKLGRHIH